MHSRAAYFLPLFAALFLFGFCANTAKDEPTLGDSLVQWGVAVTLMGVFVLVRRSCCPFWPSPSSCRSA
jgi:hypothetical protein